MKVGYIGVLLITSRPNTITQYGLRFNNGIPNQITEDLRPYEQDTRPDERPTGRTPDEGV